MRTIISLVALPAVFIAGCGSGTEPADKTMATNVVIDTSGRMDQHSYAKPEEARITHLDLDIHVDMGAHRIQGTATYDLKRAGGNAVIFDTDGLQVEKVTAPDGTELNYGLSDTTFLGQALRVELPNGVDRVSIAYSTNPNARALQWLKPSQTTDKKAPFLFTQGQAILTRSWIPVQDSPGIRFTYDAKVTVPNELMALMSAENPKERSATGEYRFKMDRPVPAYLIALAVGDIAFKPLGERTGVYAEPGVVEKAAWEFADMEKMVLAAEELYGPYRWGRYDVIVLPASFPFGGMENPMLTFATPTIIAGDRSLTSLIAHELAHSWSGNLVTNATWNDFWLNEGFTVYFEHRITEKLYGADYNAMTSLIGYQDLLGTVREMHTEKRPEDTKLKLDLAGRDPDDGMTDVAYEKGYALLRLIESKVGRPKFDAFLRGYFDRFAFQGMTTEKFEEYVTAELLAPEKVKLDLNGWIHQPGLPADLIPPVSDRFVKVEGEIERWKNGTPAKELATKEWSTFEWIHFLRHLPDPVNAERMKELDEAFAFTKSGNSEVLAAWLEQSVHNNYTLAYEKLDDFLVHTGRRKFLEPLYKEMVRTETGRAMAMHIYGRARENYHSVSVRTIDDLLAWSGHQASITL